jgi:hypothetical protein
MTWRGPEFEGEWPTLGWQVGGFIEAYCQVPSGPLAGEPFRLTDEQWRFVIALYAVDPRTCRRQVRRAVLRRAKKWGKSPFTAALAFAHLCGPTEPDGWDAAGEPVGRPHKSPWVQLAATAEDQTDNVMRPLVNMLRESPGLAQLGIDLGRGTDATTRIMLTGRTGKIEPVTAKAGTREGQLITFAVLDQTEGWLARNGGVRLAATIRRNLAPQGGMSVDTPNAHVPGEGSVAEMAWRDFEKGVPGLLYDHREGPPVPDLSDDAAVLASLEVAYEEHRAFVDLERLLAERHDEEMTPAAFRRWYLNQALAPEDDVTGAERWADLFRADAVLAPGDVVALGFDGSDSGDATVLYACRWPDFTVFRLGSWEPPEGASAGWKVPRAEVADTVRAAHEDYRVVRAYADPPLWQSELDTWAAQFTDPDGKPIWLRWPTSVPARVGPMTERWAAMAEEGTLGHDGDPVLTTHLAAARRELVGTGGWWRPAKKDTARIDAVVAAMNAVQALGDAVARGLIPAEVDAGEFVAFAR